MTNFMVICTECVHNGDLANYRNYCIESGAKITSAGEIDFESETGWFQIELNHEESFIEKFRETDACDFCTLTRII